MTNDPSDPGVDLEERSPGATPIRGVETTAGNDEPSYPGVYVEEGGERAQPIPGVETSGGGRLGFLAAAAAFVLRLWRRPPSP